MNRHLRSVLGGVLVVVTAGALAASTPAAASSKQFELLSLETTATIDPSGGMAVVEHITYRFDGGPFTIGTRSFLAADRERIQSFSASEDGVDLQVDPPADTPTGEWEWHFARPTTDETHTYELRYVVPHAVTVGTDVGELYWQFLGTDHPGVGSVRVHIVLPGSATPAVEDSPPDDVTLVRAFAHGPANGSVSLAPDHVDLAVTGVPPERFVEARVVIPRSLLSADASSGPRLARILEEEGTTDGVMNPDAGRSYIAPPTALETSLGPIGALLGLLGAGGLWARFGKEPKPDPLVGEYWREPLDDPPAVVLANLAKGGVDLARTIGATLIDLAQRGFLTIREEHVERLGPDATVRHLTRTDKDTVELALFEHQLLSYFFRSGAETTVDQVTGRARANPAEARQFATGFTAAVKQAYANRSYKESARRGIPWLIALVVVAVGLGVVGLVAGSALGLVGLVGAGVAIAVALVGLSNRSPAGATEAAKAKGLKRYLEDFSNLSEAPAGHLILWERFLVFAVTFGVAGKLLRGLETKLPTVAADPSFGVWYAGVGVHRFDSLDRFGTDVGAATARAVAPPSQSGSGGGFSGGGGGGGGGGGFGAR